MKLNVRIASLSVLLGFALISGAARAEPLYATDGLNIVTLDSTTPGVTSSIPLSGLAAAETIVGIDVRPSNGFLYGIGSTSVLYTINPLTGLATQVGSSGAFTLSGTAFGTDFNPVPDRLREVSNAEQNLRINPVTGGLAATDTSLTPAGNIVAAAYSNNFAGATVTTLYAIDSVSGNLVLIGSPNGSPNSPNGGVITVVGSLGLGVNLNENIGLDISGLTGVAYASITGGGISRLYTVNLVTGAATNIGTIGTGATPYLGLTAATAVPEPSTYALIATAALGYGMLRRFRRAKA